MAPRRLSPKAGGGVGSSLSREQSGERCPDTRIKKPRPPRLSCRGTREPQVHPRVSVSSPSPALISWTADVLASSPAANLSSALPAALNYIPPRRAVTAPGSDPPPLKAPAPALDHLSHPTASSPPPASNAGGQRSSLRQGGTLSRSIRHPGFLAF
ncbi:hypothetical protein NDU88_011953 [Pleurodeles waltl]|uniref:Uncharacterized protein n=1 Tax=Pleurodeles waltl TaxID=8319 RepID=A0AAV7R1X7_PLEWA|nr:hypothetical protein NDU88_011953 [Pleurodeles waltl]